MNAMNRQRIVIVDDDLPGIDLARSVLEADGYEVLSQAPDAGRGVAELKPHLVLVDVDAPAEVYRAGARRRHARVLLYSRADEDLLRATAARLHVDGYVCKDDRSALRLRVAAVLDR